MFKLTAIARLFLGSFLVLLLNSNGVTVAFVTNSNPVAKPSTTGLSSLSELGGNSMVSFSQVLLPTYLGAAFAALSYKIDQDPQFMVEWVKEARQNPKTAVEQITMVASFGLVTIPPFAALHTMATAGKVATTTAAGTAAGTAALAKTTTATKAVTTAKVAAATKTTAVAAAAATGGATIAIPTIAVPISFALATAYVSYEMDKDPDFAVKKLEAFVELWHTKVVQREVSATSTTRSSTSTSTSATSTSITPSNPVATSGTLAVGSTPVVATSGTLAVGSTASAAVMRDDKVAITTAAAATVNKAEPVIVAVPTTTIAATPVDEEPTKVQKALRVLQSLYFPWLPMFVPPAGSRRHKAVKFAQALYFPWLPMFMPPKKQGAQQQKA
ncbi:unnamed protein product [Cylindrotheca closterium]|uniref:Mitochondrial fission process protein 1 n=1 Tax=Cylindrotheca closterium TaxID=2856 RepID=A0AAD2FWL4_9STRA|nr:unnamed protein product [Cylindrotheca closterium]